MTMADLSTALRMREIFTQIATSTVERLRPPERIGRVFSFDRYTQTCEVLFPGETVSNLLKVHVAQNMFPSLTMIEAFDDLGYDAPSDIVRVAGTPGQYYVTDYVSGAPMPVGSEVADNSFRLNPHPNASFDETFLSTFVNLSASNVAEREVPYNWSFIWGSATSAYDVSTDVAPGGGSRSWHITLAANGNQRGMSQPFDVRPGDIVTFKIWAKSTAPDLELGLMTGTLNAPNFFTGDSTWQAQSLTDVPGDSVWREYSYTAVVPSNHIRARVVCSGFAGASNAGQLWLDKTFVTVEAAPPAYVQTGTIVETTDTVAASGYLMCTGATFSSVDHPALAAKVGDKYGTHSGTTYYLPKRSSVLPDTDWTAMTFSGSWVNYSSTYPAARYRRLKGVVYLEGLVKNGSGVITNLPAGFRPNNNGGATTEGHIFVVADASATYAGRVDVYANGNVSLIAGNAGFVSLDSIRFLAEDVAGTINYMIKT